MFLGALSEPLGPTWALSLSGLAPSALIRVPAGATLELRGVTLVLSRDYLTSLFTGMCSNTAAWPHSPGVTMANGTIWIRELDTNAPGHDGATGGGGEVLWRDVLITCKDNDAYDRPVRPGLWEPYPCAARAVSADSDGGAEALRRASSALLGVTQGPVFLSLASDISLASGLWNVLLRGAVGRLVLLGAPGAATTLDLAGREDAWVWEPSPWSPDPTHAYLYDMTLVLLRGAVGRLVLLGAPGAATTLDLAGREDAWVWEPSPWSPDPTHAYLYDMTLVNLPYSTHPGSPADLMALAALSFGIR
ncbi:hypothetical protein GPECTOR_44g87 [Gonium pectorale]|uniref:Uncharacterized protein n=1 Tax=Gonium pectorale TaxID=33097 RepID=A0A150G9H2_GONPE|nr:hypothetical protein GPECTOR_44g87 [Gonium pectorale]|eukprot:KXZ46413.1 hypothetical protein GPECTOR_44g87 [Gonium pectorale]